MHGNGAGFWCGRSKDFGGKAGQPKKGGWNHYFTTDAPRDIRPTPRPVRTTPAEPRPDFSKLAARFHATPGQIDHLAGKLRLSSEVLRRLRIGWSDAIPGPDGATYIAGTTTPCREPGVWLFPMCAGRLSDRGAPVVVGYRVRTINGEKYAIAGSDGSALFIPAGVTRCRGGLLLLPEGPTSAAALLSLGFVAVGRPNCNAGIEHLRALLRSLKPARVVVIGDNDSKPDGLWPGRDGACSIANALDGYARIVSVAMPPAGIKDARAWLHSGATAPDVWGAITAGMRGAA